MPTLSAVIIAFNEAHQIERTIRACQPFCDEIVVIDAESTDNTVALCQSLGCRVFVRKFEGYGAQKNFGIEQAIGEWIISLDADEVCSPALTEEILAWKNQPQMTFDAYFIPRSMVFGGRVFQFSREARQPVLRLFRKGSGKFSAAMVHESLEVNGLKGHLKNILLHYSYRSLHHYFEKFNDYTTYASRDMAAQGKKIGWLRILTRQPVEFLKIYLVQKNCLEGIPGLIWSLVSSFYPVVKYLKLYELQQLDAKSK